jgi:hypothetical protein
LDAHPDFEPTLTTPAAPEYPSGHSVLGGAMVEVLKSVNKGNDATPGPMVLTASNGVQRTYYFLSNIATESAVSRVFSGGHFNFTTAPSQALGQKVAQTIMTGFDQKYGAGVASLQQAPPGAANKGKRRKKGKRSLRA